MRARAGAVARGDAARRAGASRQRGRERGRLVRADRARGALLHRHDTRTHREGHGTAAWRRRHDFRCAGAPGGADPLAAWRRGRGPRRRPRRPPPRRGVPILWLQGSASVLLHESHGHAVEHGHAPAPLPEWLRVEIPVRLRRASFRDVPLLRMTEVRAMQTGAPFALPSEHIEVHLVEGGAYEPLTGMVTVRIAAATRDAQPVAPFDFSGDGTGVRPPGAT